MTLSTTGRSAASKTAKDADNSTTNTEQPETPTTKHYEPLITDPTCPFCNRDCISASAMEQVGFISD